MTEKKGIYFVGTGISGGEEGALHGPSVMPGGSVEAWPLVKDILQGISAKLDDGSPCCEWIGAGGAGHFVKMVHNGIEYADMQLIAEAYGYMRDALKFNNEKIHRIFSNWSRGELAVGDNVDALTGATVTSKAVVKAVNSASAFVTGADVSSSATEWGG